MYCIFGGLSAPFFPKSHKNKEIQRNAHYKVCTEVIKSLTIKLYAYFTIHSNNTIVA